MILAGNYRKFLPVIEGIIPHSTGQTIRTDGSVESRVAMDLLRRVTWAKSDSRNFSAHFILINPFDRPYTFVFSSYSHPWATIPIPKKIFLFNRQHLLNMSISSFGDAKNYKKKKKKDPLELPFVLPSQESISSHLWGGCGP